MHREKSKKPKNKMIKAYRHNIPHISENPYDSNRDLSSHLLPQRSIMAFLEQIEEFQIRMGFVELKENSLGRNQKFAEALDEVI